MITNERAYIQHTDYDKEPGGLKRLEFIVKSIQNYQYSQHLNSQDINILDLGCGNGNITIPLASLYYNILGVDSDEASIEKAKAKNKFNNAVFTISNIEAMKCSKEYDIVIACEVLEHLRDPLRILKFIHSTLKPSGILLISIPNGFSPEELIRKFLTHNRIGLKIKKFLRSTILKKETIQSQSESPHLHFFSLTSFKKLLYKAGFQVIIKNDVFIFRGLFYIFLRFFIKRESKLFHAMNNVDYKLSEIIPVFLGEGWLIKAKLIRPQ